MACILLQVDDNLSTQIWKTRKEYHGWSPGKVIFTQLATVTFIIFALLQTIHFELSSSLLLQSFIGYIYFSSPWDTILCDYKFYVRVSK